MSKSTKIIAIVGGLVIAVAAGYMLFSGGSTMDAMGCGGKKGKKARRVLSKADVEWAGCKKYGYIPKLVQKTVDKGRNKGEKYWATIGGKRPEPRGGKANMKKATCDCLDMWKSKCASEDKDKSGKTFKQQNAQFCSGNAALIAKKGCGGGGDDDDDAE